MYSTATGRQRPAHRGQHWAQATQQQQASRRHQEEPTIRCIIIGAWERARASTHQPTHRPPTRSNPSHHRNDSSQKPSTHSFNPFTTAMTARRKKRQRRRRRRRTYPSVEVAQALGVFGLEACCALGTRQAAQRSREKKKSSPSQHQPWRAPHARMYTRIHTPAQHTYYAKDRRKQHGGETNHALDAAGAAGGGSSSSRQQ